MDAVATVLSRRPRGAQAAERRRTSTTEPPAASAAARANGHEQAAGVGAGGGEAAVAGVDGGGLRVQAVDGLHQHAEVGGFGRADRVHDGGLTLHHRHVGRPDHGVGGAGERHRGGHGAGRQVGLGLVRVGEVGEHGLASGEHVDRGSGRRVAHHEPSLAGGRGRHVVDERGERGLAALGQVGDHGDVGACGERGRRPRGAELGRRVGVGRPDGQGVVARGQGQRVGDRLVGEGPRGVSSSFT